MAGGACARHGGPAMTWDARWPCAVAAVRPAHWGEGCPGAPGHHPRGPAQGGDDEPLAEEASRSTAARQDVQGYP